MIRKKSRIQWAFYIADLFYLCYTSKDVALYWETRYLYGKVHKYNSEIRSGVMASVSLSRIIEKFKLENLTPEIETKGIKITQPDINRPALQLAGYFEHYEATRLQIIGFVEYT